MSITFRKGPLGWAVNKDGRPVGSIKHDKLRGYLVSIEGFRVGVDPATRGTHVFPSYAAAAKKVREVLK